MDLEEDLINFERDELEYYLLGKIKAIVDDEFLKPTRKLKYIKDILECNGEMTFKKLIAHIALCSKFGIKQYKDTDKQDVYITDGIDFALQKGLLENKQIEEAISRFNSNKFGIAYDFDETPIKNREYGEYKTDIEAKGEEAYIWVHREQHPKKKQKDYIIVYFHFER